MIFTSEGAFAWASVTLFLEADGTLGWCQNCGFSADLGDWLGTDDKDRVVVIAHRTRTESLPLDGGSDPAREETWHLVRDPSGALVEVRQGERLFDRLPSTIENLDALRRALEGTEEPP